MKEHELVLYTNWLCTMGITIKQHNIQELPKLYFKSLDKSTQSLSIHDRKIAMIQYQQKVDYFDSLDINDIIEFDEVLNGYVKAVSKEYLEKIMIREGEIPNVNYRKIFPKELVENNPEWFLLYAIDTKPIKYTPEIQKLMDDVNTKGLSDIAVPKRGESPVIIRLRKKRNDN